MILKLDNQEFNLSSEVIKTMLKLMEATQKDGREHGFSFCKTELGNIIPGPICKGSKCEITLRGCYITGKDDVLGKDVGSFHTHPAEMGFGFDDYLFTIKKATGYRETKPYRRFICLSTPRGDVRCTAIKELPLDFLFGMRMEDLEGLGSNEDTKKLKSFFTNDIVITGKDLLKSLEEE